MRIETVESFTIDANILFYSVDAQEPQKRKIAKGIVDSYLENGEHVILLQVLGELANAVRNKKTDESTLADAEDMIKQFLTIENIKKIHYGSGTLADAMKLSSLHNKPFWDCVIAATMIENGVRVIYTENASDFSGISGIEAVNPFRKSKK